MWPKFRTLVAVMLFLLLSIAYTARRTGIFFANETVSDQRSLSSDTTLEGGDVKRFLVDDIAESSAIIAKWLSENRLPKEVFNLLQLPKSAEELLNDPKVELWFDYVYAFRAQYPTTKESPLSILVELFTFEKVSVAINALKYSNIQRWEKLKAGWKLYCKQPVELSIIDKSIYRNDFIGWWIDYTSIVNMENQSKQISMTSLMRKYLSDRNIVGKVEIIIRNGDYNDRIVAKEIKEEIIRDWVVKKMPDDALKELQLNDGSGQTPIGTPLYRFWIDYLEVFNKVRKESATTSAEVFLRHYKLSRVSEMIALAEASNFRDVSEAAQHFKLNLLEHLLSNDISPKKLYKPLQDKRSGIHLWIEYLNYYIARFGNGDELLKWVIDTNPDKIFTILQAAWNQESLKSSASLLLVREGGKVLREKNMSPQKIFNQFKLNQIGNELLNNPLFGMWLKYSKRFQTKHPKGGYASCIVTLDKFYNDVQICNMIEKGLQNPDNKNMAQEVENAFMEFWLRSARNPNVFFTSLQLHKVVDDPYFMARPTFNIWNKYIKRFYKVDAKAMTAVVSTIKQHFPQEAISIALKDALRDPATENLAIELLKALKVRKRI